MATMDIFFVIFGAAITYFFVFILSALGCLELAAAKGRRPLTWAMSALVVGPLALAILAILPRLEPTPSELFVEVWRLGVRRAERAAIVALATPESAVGDNDKLRALVAAKDNRPLRTILIAALKNDPEFAIQRILERRARMTGALDAQHIDMQTVRMLAEALALDPDEAIATARKHSTESLSLVAIGGADL